MSQVVSNEEFAIESVVTRHAEDARMLWLQRMHLTSAPHVALRHLERHDKRLAASLDGLEVSGAAAWRALNVELANVSPPTVFVATILSLRSGDATQVTRLMALVDALPETARAFHSALGWLAPKYLRGSVQSLLASDHPAHRRAGLAACALHRVAPGERLEAEMQSADEALAGRALRAAGELGRGDVLPIAVRQLDRADDASFWAAWACVLLGHRGTALEVLQSVASAPGPQRARALKLVLQTLSSTDAGSFLSKLARLASEERPLIMGCGVSGDAKYIPWLINRMSELPVARLAGEAFSLITGLDLARLDLESRPPEGFQAGPNDEPDDPDVALDDDEGLPWPDSKKISEWWRANDHRFQPGLRFFMGDLVTRSQCVDVMKRGYQRQRMYAAHYLPLMQPGETLFEWRAPTWRQQRLLAQMS